mmetsp:Transcript_13288/g.16157  ORF Transcript_13288/g.16157 Transcript_13288/m.16157 type:complete len:82 (+) Transcript_13288:2-247(+)
MATRARSNPRCEEVYACIENTVDMIKHNYMDSVISPDKSWYHPAMQQCIRLQLLERCDIFMRVTGLTYTDFFQSFSAIKIP